MSPDVDLRYKMTAEKLMETASKAMEKTVEVGNPVCLFTRDVLSLPLRKLSSKVIAKDKKFLLEHPEPLWRDESKTAVEWEWIYAISRLDLAETQKRTMVQDYEIQAFRIGDFAMLGVKGEPFVEMQLAVKKASPAPYTFVAHFCNGYAGYLPTRRAFEGGGYETRTGAGSRWDKSALERVEKASKAMLRSLWK